MQKIMQFLHFFSLQHYSHQPWMNFSTNCMITNCKTLNFLFIIYYAKCSTNMLSNSQCFFFQGWCFAHSLIAIIVSYLLLQIVGPSMATVGLTFLFNMVSVVRGHFKGHRLPKGTHLNFRARLFKGQIITVGLVQGW